MAAAARATEADRKHAAREPQRAAREEQKEQERRQIAARLKRMRLFRRLLVQAEIPAGDKDFFRWRLEEALGLSDQAPGQQHRGKYFLKESRYPISTPWSVQLAAADFAKPELSESLWVCRLIPALENYITYLEVMASFPFDTTQMLPLEPCLEWLRPIRGLKHVHSLAAEPWCDHAVHFQRTFGASDFSRGDLGLHGMMDTMAAFQGLEPLLGCNGLSLTPNQIEQCAQPCAALRCFTASLVPQMPSGRLAPLCAAAPCSMFATSAVKAQVLKLTLEAHASECRRVLSKVDDRTNAANGYFSHVGARALIHAAATHLGGATRGPVPRGRPVRPWLGQLENELSNGSRTWSMLNRNSIG